MALKQGDKIKRTNIFAGKVIGDEHNPLLQKVETEDVTPIPETKAIKQSTTAEAITEINVLKKTVPIKKAVEIPKENVVTDSIGLMIKKPKKKTTQYVTFVLQKSTIDLINDYAGRGKGKDRTGYNKSEFVDLMLVKAINALKLGNIE